MLVSLGSFIMKSNKKLGQVHQLLLDYFNIEKTIYALKALSSRYNAVTNLFN